MLAPGTRLGPYEITAPIGAGGMGEVYRATDTRLGREIALKLLPANAAGGGDGANAEALARFEREARAVAALNHPNIVVLHSIEEADGTRFLTMELVEGDSLARLVQPGGVALARVLELGIPLADALAAAHEKGIVHRDLKPANVMVTREGRVKVLDFGLATVVARAVSDPSTAMTETAHETTGGAVMGTLAYMAPEQLRGEAVDARADLFALGVVLHELATGARPFQGGSAADVASAILRDTPPPVPGELGAVVARCLAKDRQRRVQTAREVHAALVALRAAPATAPALPSIAVLPFTSMGKAGDDDAPFSDGVTEDVIAQLCKIRTLKVISRQSVMPFKDRAVPLPEVARQLGVANVLDGSIRRVGDRVRIVAQLIDVATGRSLWAETYDRELTDIFAIQSDVALSISNALEAELTPRVQERIRREPTHDVIAYEHYLRGRHAFVRYTSDELERSIEHFDRAIARDPAFALAYVGVALANTELAEYGAHGRAQVGERALAAAARAIALDPESAEAHVAHAYALLVFRFDFGAAESGFRRALELSPNLADAFDLYGRMCAGLGRFDEAIELHEKAYELDPLTHRGDIATTYLRAGRAPDAERAARRALAVDPHDPRLHATLAWARFRQGHAEEGVAELERAVHQSHTRELMWLAQLGEMYGLAGRLDQAREVLAQLEERSRPGAPSPYHLAYVYTGLGEVDRAMDQLELAFERGAGAMYGIRGSFLLAPLRTSPRFVALLARMGLG